jgi:hypothetical protein
MSEADKQLIQLIDQLSQLNRESRSPRLAGALLELRHRAASARCQVADTDLALPFADLPDRFVGCHQLPEITARDLDTRALVSGLHHHGALLVRGLFSDDHLQRLRLELLENDTAAQQDDIPLGCTPSVLFELLEVYHECGLLEVILDYQDGQSVLFAERAKLRRHLKKRDAYAAIPWHQDVNFFGYKSYAVNCWAAITPCGEHNPGLGIIPRRTEQRHGWEGPGLAPLDYGNRLPEGLLEELTRDHPAAYPVLQPGDAVLFDEMTIHGTASRPWAVEEQVVAISWFFRASHFPDWGTPLLV